MVILQNTWLRNISLVVFLLVALHNNAHASLTVQVDRTNIALDETLSLTVIYSGNQAAVPNFNKLSSDFTILGQAQSSQMTITNNVTAQSLRWTLTLSPKKKGVLTIPAFKVGRDTSDALQITVTQDSTNTNGNSQGDDQQFMVKASISDVQPYIQQELLLIISLFYQDNMSNIQQPEITIPNITVTPTEANRKYRKTIKGKVYNVIEVSYVLRPNTIGDFEIPSLAYVGEAAGRSRFFGRYSTNGFPQNAKRFYARTNPLSFSVRPIPDQYPKTAAWFPAKSIDINDSFKQETGLIKTKVGDAISRTFSFTVKGQTSQLLPSLNFKDSPNYKLYKESPVDKQTLTFEGTVGNRQVALAIVPTAVGEGSLPEIQFHWWNVITDSLETITLSGQNWDALPNPAFSDTTQPNTDSSMSIANTAPTAAVSNSTLLPLNQSEKTRSSRLLWGFCFLLLLAWLITLYAWYKGRVDAIKQKRSFEAESALRSAKAKTLKQCYYALKEAHDLEDLTQFKQHLLNWGQQYFDRSGLTSLGKIRQVSQSSILNQQLELLEYQLYHPSAQQPFDTGILLETIATLNQKKGFVEQAKQKTQGKIKRLLRPTLAKLYPQ